MVHENMGYADNIFSAWLKLFLKVEHKFRQQHVPRWWEADPFPIAMTS